MRILMVHNFYGSGSPSGENQVFYQEKNLLMKNGNEVESFTTSSDSILNQGKKGLLIGALSTPWNFKMAKRIYNKVEDFKPDIVHVHNTFPLISPSVFHSISNRAARVLTLHNYRLFCPAAIPMRNGKLCTDCIDQKSVLPALHYGCYRNNHLATIPLALNIWLHRFLNTWKNQVDGFITLTEFQKNTMIKAGLPSAKVHVKPNFYPGNPPTIQWEKRENAVVFAGRISQEKGIGTLVRAWLEWRGNAPELKIVGDGPLRSSLERMASTQPECKITFLGQVSSKEAEKNISKSKLLILPSECFEGFPMVIREAFAFGTPVAVSNIGPLPFIVKEGINGVVFEPHNIVSLQTSIQKLWNSPKKFKRLGDGAKKSFLKNYTEETNYQTLLNIYKSAIVQQKHS